MNAFIKGSAKYRELIWMAKDATDALNALPEFIDYLEMEEGEYLDWDELYVHWKYWARENLTFISRLRMYIHSKKLRP